MIKSFKEWLNESKQVGVIYHFTTLDNLQNIIDSGFRFTSNNGYISTTRNFLLSDKVVGHIRVKFGHTVRIALDGNKISENFKVIPVSGLMDDGEDVLKIDKRLEKHRVSRKWDENEELIIPNLKGNYFRKYILNIGFSTYDSIKNDVKINHLRSELNKLGISSNMYRKWGPIIEDVIPTCSESPNYKIMLKEH